MIRASYDTAYKEERASLFEKMSSTQRIQGGLALVAEYAGEEVIRVYHLRDATIKVTSGRYKCPLTIITRTKEQEKEAINALEKLTELKLVEFRFSRNWRKKWQKINEVRLINS